MKINLRTMSRLEGSEPERLVVRLSGARTAQFGAGAVGVVLLAGSFLGGAAGHAGLAKSSSQTWLQDGPRGELVEIDTASGQAQQRLTVSARGDELVVHQRDGDLLVQDRTTGTLRTIDLTTLLSEGERQVQPGADTVVILDGPRVALAELSTGVIQGIDPVSAASIGTPFSIGAPLTAAVSDKSGHVWGLSSAGRLVELAWGGSGYKVRDSLQVKGAGEGSGLSAHDSGVTVMVTPTGSVEDAADNAGGTTNVRPASGLGRSVLVGASTPAGVVPAASNGTSVVVIATPTGVVQPDVAAAGCPHPLAPVVFDDRVYVPCQDSPVVVVLNPDGSSAGPPLVVPPSHNPEVSVANGTLVVNAPGTSSVVLVNPKGASTVVGTEPPGIPTTSQADPVPMPSPSTPPSKQPKPAPSHSAQPSKSADPAPTVGVTLSPGRPHDGSIAITVNWSVTNASDASKFLVTVAVDGGTSQTRQVGGNKRSAVITLACPSSCSGTANVALMNSSGPDAQASNSWTSVTPDPGAAGTSPKPGSTPRPGNGSGGGSGGGSGSDPTSDPGDGPVVGQPASATPTLGSTGVPVPPGSSASPTATISPTPVTTPPMPPTSSTPKASPTPGPVQTTAAPVQTTPAPVTTTPAPVQTTPAPVQTTPAAPPPTTASPAAPAGPTAGETLITGSTTVPRGTSVTLTITEPADWAASGASCAVLNDGDDGATGTFTCDSTTAFTQREVTSGGDYEDYYVRATLPNGSTVDSAHREVDTPEPPCTGGACCNSSLIQSHAQSGAVAAEPAVSNRQYGLMPNQVAPCP